MSAPEAAERDGKIETAAQELAKEAVSRIGQEPYDFAAHAQILQDLKGRIIEEAERICNQQGQALPEESLEAGLAAMLPSFNAFSLYQTRTSLLATAAAVCIGWIAGGIISALLGFIGLGGDIIRAGVIFGAIWLGEFLMVNPRARRLLLAAFGLGALTRFASLLAGGVFRFTGMSALKRLLFGAGRPGVLRSLWLVGGAFFLMAFLAKKVTALDLTAFSESLVDQIRQRLRLVCFVLEKIGALESSLRLCRADASAKESQTGCPRHDCQLAQGVIELLDALPEQVREFLRHRLEAMGYQDAAESGDYLIWQGERDAPLYETIGLVGDGDLCRILRRPIKTPDGIRKGHVQKAAVQEGATRIRAEK